MDAQTERLLKGMHEAGITYTDGIFAPKEAIMGEFKVSEKALKAAFDQKKVIKIYGLPIDKVPDYFGVLERNGCIGIIKEPAPVLGFTYVNLDKNVPLEALYGLIVPYAERIVLEESEKGRGGALLFKKKVAHDSPEIRIENAQRVIKSADVDAVMQKEYTRKLEQMNKATGKERDLPGINEVANKFGFIGAYRGRLEEYELRKENIEAIMGINTERLADNWREWEF